ncbi:MAG: hypothetical protein R2802_00430 [Flavobacteriaceae bacterium]
MSSVGDSFRFTTESEDAQGFTHVEFTQVFNAIPVLMESRNFILIQTINYQQ